MFLESLRAYPTESAKTYLLFKRDFTVQSILLKLEKHLTLNYCLTQTKGVCFETLVLAYYFQARNDAT